ncbi:hypothetical protein JAO73_03870 [Hymenobacter sp. BT523]|uniref:hypothetical protein n=1 Tax=Hymenobacter sp. BT523 TaxID=2795725 RepID=UPI0018EB32F9|nr:hypothetical protein [Hymenobacter sp. BT523]MBJ6108136.1 hypothetical protein [Hymenobacter sp. BT523]
MSSEIRLLSEIIRCVPTGSIWHISSDSWAGIKTTFGSLLVDNAGDWQILITDENRDAVIQKAEEEEVAEKGIHMDIESENQTILFRSYDAMCTIILNKEFYRELNTTNVSSELEIMLD